MLFFYFRYEDASQTFLRRTLQKAKSSEDVPKMPYKRMAVVCLFSLMMLLVVFVPVYVPIAVKYSSGAPRRSDAEAFVYFQPQPNGTRVVRVTSLSGKLESPIRGFAKFHTVAANETLPTAGSPTPPVVVNLHVVMSATDVVTVVDQTTWESERPEDLGTAVILLSEEPHRPSSPLRTPDPGMENVPMFVLRKEDVAFFQEFGRHQSLTLVKDKGDVPDPMVDFIIYPYHHLTNTFLNSCLIFSGSAALANRTMVGCVHRQFLSMAISKEKNIGPRTATGVDNPAQTSTTLHLPGTIVSPQTQGSVQLTARYE